MKKINRNLKAEPAIAALREEFRDWYGTISVGELVSNPTLTRWIEILERLLATREN